MNILVFGQLTDITGTDTFVVSNVADTDGLMKELKKLYPDLSNTKFRVAVDKLLINENTPLTNNSTIALLPPFSGG